MDVFTIGPAQLEALCKKDARMRHAVETIGPIRRAVDSNLFASLIDSIVGQQISSKAHATVWGRLRQTCGEVTPERLCDMSVEQIQAHGMSMRKAGYIRQIAELIGSGAFDLQQLYDLPDQEVSRLLATLPGIGVWTAEMIMLFCMQRPDIVSQGDLGIIRGMRMLYRHKTITKQQFERYRKRYSPYGSIASLYLWAIAGGAMEGLTDPAAKRTASKPAARKVSGGGQ